MRNTGDDIQQIQMDTIKDFVIQRLQFLSQKMNENGLNVPFNFASGGGALGGDFGLIGGFFVDMYIWDSLMNVGDQMLMDEGITDEPVISTSFNQAVLAMVEGYSLLNDDRIYAFRSRRVNDYYPEGRKPMKNVSDPKRKKQFNQVANQNIAPAHTQEAELMALYDLLNKLEELDKAHVRTLTLEKGKNAYKTITKLHQRVIKDGGVDMMMGGLRAAI